MFSKQEKQFIASEIEKILLGLQHPEMPTKRPVFSLHVNGKEAWSWANIEPNWMYGDKGSPVNPNPWNEKSRDILN